MKKMLLPLIMMLGVGTASAEAPKPLLWKVSDADNSLYLLGSFHMLKAEDYPLAKSTDVAFDDAEQVYFEITPDEANNPALGQKMTQAAMRTDGKTLQQSVSAETWKKFEDYAAKNNLPTANFQSFEAWFVGLILTLTETQKIGMESALGLDKHFMDRAAKSGKPGKGLETGDSQIAIFDNMTAKQQEQFLQEALGDSDKLKAEMEKLHSAWRKGDDKALFKKLTSDMRKNSPELYQIINLDRNKAWLPKLEDLLKTNTNDDILVVVGAMHLVGNDGVVKMLKDKGYKVERMK